MTLKVAIAIYEHDQWDNHMLMDNYKLFPKSPSSSSIASGTSSNESASSYHSIESGISSMSPQSHSYHINTPSNFESLKFSALEKPKKAFQAHTSYTQEEPIKKILTEEFEEREEKVMYQGRDLLDLGSNIRMGWNFKTTKLPIGMEKYFDNRSQYSRIQGAFPPPHENQTCPDEDCSFLMPIYY